MYDDFQWHMCLHLCHHSNKPSQPAAALPINNQEGKYRGGQLGKSAQVTASTCHNCSTAGGSSLCHSADYAMELAPAALCLLAVHYSATNCLCVL